MNLLSINVGLPREIQWQGKLVRTSIFKSPVLGQVRVSKLNLEGDQQSDLSVHGGVHKAVYAYPSEHYEFWREEVPDTDLHWGAFGENLTTQGMVEEEVRIGDRLRIGSAEFIVTQPRMPCFKLGIRLGRPDIVNRFLHSGRSGFYLAVLEEGQITAGGSIEVLTRDERAVTVADIVNLYQADATNQELLRRASALPALPPDWRDHFRKRLRNADG
jgi:MOSC domain-containing protein YiiM